MSFELLVAIDGSTHSERIVKYAVELAKRLSANIALLYVAPTTQIPEAYKQYAKEENIGESDYYDTVGRQILAKYANIVKNGGVECESIAEVGNAAENIMIVAKDRKSEMIIVGLQGLHGLARVRSLGSVSRRIIENSPTPVITVP
jgi:nucleotide-binding universal stress UspA family protein